MLVQKPSLIEYFRLVLSGRKGLSVSFLSATFLLLINTGATTSAQIVPDNTLPNNSVTLPNGNLIEIQGGTTAGNNLFHSFEQFSLLTGNTAWFNHASSIENIITRVTGSSISEIDGLIRANGTANLFLINPNGIVFGENAALDIGGSFLGSTADSIKFTNGSEFSAVDPQAPPLLTVNIPLGLQYGSNNGDIVVRGSGNQLQFNPNFTVNRNSRPDGLQVDARRTLALVGGNILIDGGNLTAETGRIELGSVADEGFVKLNSVNSGWNLDYSEVSSFQDIALSNASSLEVSGNGGEVRLQGKEIIITDGSAILADTLGDIDGGKLEVNASELLVVAGTSTELPFISRLSTDVAPKATGNGGDIELNAGSLIIADGAQVISSSYGSGNTGNITVKADDVQLMTGSGIVGASGLYTLVFGTGDGGDIEIEADNISITNGARAATLTFSNGDGGNLTAKANQIELVGTSPNGFSSGLLSNVEINAFGNAGTLSIETESLLITDGAQVAVTTFGKGNAGLLNILADEIQLIGFSPQGNPSGLFSNVEANATGKGGQINIEGAKLGINDGAQIAALTQGLGEGGNIQIKTNEIEIIGGVSNIPSGIQSTVTPPAEGNGGNVIVDTGSLIIDGGQIAVSTAGIGDGGELAITANEIELIGSSELGASGIFGNAIIGTGNGGNLQINTNNLTILDGATISVSNFSSRNDRPPGQGKAGNISIEANSLLIDSLASETSSSINASTNAGGGGEITLNVIEGITLSNNSQIIAETQDSGEGGSIAIKTQNLKLDNLSQVSVNSSGLGQAGNIDLIANRIDANRSNITATSTESGGGDINLTTKFLFLDNNSLISTSVLDSTGGGGNLTIDSQYIIAQDDSDLRANADLGRGGNIDIRTEVILLSLDSDIDASSQFGIDGVVNIQNPELDEQTGLVSFSDEVSDPTDLILAVCPLELDNVMLTTGKGGLSENPSQALRGQSFWDDLRDFSSGSQVAANTTNQFEANKTTKIAEAEGWIVNEKGNVELLNHFSFNQCRE